jgi:capsular polysaccharide biosynthesis protein
MSHGTADTSDAASAPDQPNADQSVNGHGSKSAAAGRWWAYDGFTSAVESPLADDPAADPTAGPTRRRSIRAALRRRTWLWCITAVIGLIAGLGLFAQHPPGYQASASVLLTYAPSENAAEASVTDLALAQSRSVAAGTLRRLGLQEGLANFLASYTVTAVTERVLLITITAPSSEQAVVRANALAAEFLQFRAALLENEQQQVFAALDRQFAQAPSPAILSMLQAAIVTYQANAQVATTSTVNGSKVLSVATPIRRSLRKTLADPAGGLLGGLGLGMGLVIVETLVSDRIRWRDDVAHALGAPVKFSVGKVRLSRWLPGRLGLAATRRAKIQRIAAYLGGVVPPKTGNAAALAVVPVRDSRVAALSLVALARQCAEHGQRVILADLCRGAPAARMLRAKAPGLHEVNARGVRLTVAVPDRDDLVPVGPLDRDPRRSRVDQPAEPLVAACASADLILTLADLDPALGAEHLPGWATDAVVVVTAGRSSSAKIHMTGEMIRLAGLSLVSGVLVGADKTDESLGADPGPDAAAETMSLPQTRTGQVQHLLPGAR